MIHPKAKAWTNIPLCCMISMLVVRPALKIDVLKMEHVFQMGYQEGDKVFYVSPTNQQGEEAFVAYHIHEWDSHWEVCECSIQGGVEL